ncbi:MAG: YidE/YbjL duplication [Clostridiales bacterium]|nr:YidE/YbjL duplication [Clostridiales bacterium]
MEYLGITLSALLTTLFIVFVVIVLGFLLGGINVKGISLGTAGVLLTAIVAGVIFYLCGDEKGETAVEIGNKTITFWNASVNSTFSLISNIGTVLFVTAVGLIAGPKFFRSFNKSMIAYVVMGAAIVLTGVTITVIISWLDPNMNIAMGTGLLSGSLTSTPAFGAAKESAGELAGDVTAGYGIGYLYGVLGVVLFVQVMPKILKVDIAKERESFVAANTVVIPDDGKKRFKIDEFAFFPFFVTIVLGLLIGCVKIPIGGGNYFSFGSSGGTLIAGLIVGHFGHFGKIDMKISKQTLNFFRELGLVLFLVGAGVPGGVKFVSAFDWIYIVYGIIMATVPMVLGFVLGKYVFKLSIFNNLGSITGGMTSTPALGSLIAVAGTDDVSSAYAATYPFALVLIVVSCNLMVLLPI